MLPSPDSAVHALMGLRETLPLIAALGAASPYWFGMDSGLASARSAVIRASRPLAVPTQSTSCGTCRRCRAVRVVRAG